MQRKEGKNYNRGNTGNTAKDNNNGKSRTRCKNGNIANIGLRDIC